MQQPLRWNKMSGRRRMRRRDAAESDDGDEMSLSCGGACVALTSRTGLLVTCVLLLLSAELLDAQTEGDTGYEYNEAYDDSYDEDSGLEPAFDVPIVNVTVVAGQTALLPCSIDYLGKYKVAWLDHKSIPLTYEDRRVVDDFRFTIVRPYVKEWNLQIRDIKWEDQGMYRCTINTNPVKSKVVMLHVKVPATIIDELSSDDTTVQEGDVVVLVCNVTGVPTPDVTWYRRPAAPGRTGERERIGMMGEMIIIQNVSRYCDDYYECVASNGVPPSVSRQMRVTVEFEPEIQLPNRRMGQARGRETILECYITAYPQAVNYWEKDGRKVQNTKKHRVDAYDHGENTLVLSLRIIDIELADYGEYKCVASNALGRDEQSMYLYEYAESDSDKTSPLQEPSVVPQQFVTYSPLRSPVTQRRTNDNLAYGYNYAASSTRNGGGRSTSHLYSSSSGTSSSYFLLLGLSLTSALLATFCQQRHLPARTTGLFAGAGAGL